jgi:hypothetical protein
MEPLWGPVVASGGNPSQIAHPRNPRDHAKAVAVSCDPLPKEAHADHPAVRSPGANRCARHSPFFHPDPPASKGDFDTVLDEPHFHAGLFVPNYNDGDSRLLNVAPP